MSRLLFGSDPISCCLLSVEGFAEILGIHHTPDPPRDPGKGEQEAGDADTSRSGRRRVVGGLYERGRGAEQTYKAAKPCNSPNDWRQNHQNNPTGDTPSVELTEPSPQEREHDRRTGTLDF